MLRSFGCPSYRSSRTEIEMNLLQRSTSKAKEKLAARSALLSRKDEEKLLRALLLAQEREPSCSFAMKIYVQFNIE